MTLPDRIPRDARRVAVLYLWLANVGLGMAIGVNYLWHVPEGEGPRLWVFALFALVSSILTLTLVPCALFYAAAHAFRSVRALGWIQAAVWTVFLVLLYSDTRIYNAFRYHYNGEIWNIFTTRAADDAVHLGWQVWTAVFIGLSCVGSLEILLWRRLVRRAVRDTERAKRRGFRMPRPIGVGGAFLLSAVFVDKTLYAEADLSRDQHVTGLAEIFPLYARVPADDLASAVLGVDRQRPPRVEVEGYELDYPHRWPEVDPEGPRPNVLLLVIDCLRADMLPGEATPGLSAWGAGARRFSDHLSSGNSTRFGVLGLLYGLHGTYWSSLLVERRPPVLIEALREEGYRFGVFSSASMDYPELRDTAWSSIRESVHDRFGDAEPWRRDELAAAALSEWIEGAPGESRPFFAFLLLDSPHQAYSYPPDVAPFQPAADELDYLALTRNEGPEPDELERVANRYRNAVYHADRVAASLLEELERTGIAEETLVFVTGDHGEEFRECGFFGHTSAFTPEQIAVPLLVRGPGVEPGVETRPTSHLDFAPTVLEQLGADPATRADWTLGANLFDPPAGRRRVVSGWNQLGLWTPDAILRVRLSIFEFDVEVYDRRWRRLPDDAGILAAEADSLLRLGRECNRFLR